VLEDVTVEQLGLGTRLAECLEQTAAQFLPAVSGIDHPVKEIRHRPPGPAEPDLFARHGSGCGHHALALDYEDLRIGVKAAALPVIGALMIETQSSSLGTAPRQGAQGSVVAIRVRTA